MSYPNPTSGMMTFNYSLAEQSNASIHIYNMTGDLVRTLLDAKTQEAGVYQVLFDASDQVSGMYIAILEVDGMNVQQQLLVVE
ncbi:MAG: T9SS type A sorting domain-containing protein [Bacteroidota bacterium]